MSPWIFQCLKWHETIAHAKALTLNARATRFALLQNCCFIGGMGACVCPKCIATNRQRTHRTERREPNAPENKSRKTQTKTRYRRNNDTSSLIWPNYIQIARANNNFQQTMHTAVQRIASRMANKFHKYTLQNK